MTDAKTRLANRERQRRYREAHREEINQQRKERYNDRIATGKCPRCNGKIRKGYTLCADCCEYQANLNRKYAKTRKKAGTTRTATKTATSVRKATKKNAKAKPSRTAKKPTVKKPITKKPAVKKTAAKKKPAKKK